MIVGPPPPSTPRHKKYPTKGPTAPPRESPQYSPRSGCRASRLSLEWPAPFAPATRRQHPLCSAGRRGSFSVPDKTTSSAGPGGLGGVPLSCSSWRGPAEAVGGLLSTDTCVASAGGGGSLGRRGRQPPKDQVCSDVGPCPSTDPDPCHHLPVGRPGLLCGLRGSWREPSPRGVPRALVALFPVFTMVRVIEEDGPSQRAELGTGSEVVSQQKQALW